jgi:ABC-type polysaccharide/polyol phosphate export permease
MDAAVPKAQPGSGAKAVLKFEILEAVRHFDFAFQIAWSNARAEYRRSFLGPGWLVIGTAIGVGGMGFVWGALFNAKASDFVPLITVGFVVWYLLSTSVVGASSVYYRNRELFLNRRVSSLLVSTVHLLEQLVDFAHNLIVVLVVLLLFPDHVSLAALWAIPGTLLVLINLLWIIQVIGYVGARYRDFEPLIASIIQPLFLITPVLFRPDQLGPAIFIVYINPFAYWLKLVRDPLLGHSPDPTTWLVCIGMAIAGWTLALRLTIRKRAQLGYWVS